MRNIRRNGKAAVLFLPLASRHFGLSAKKAASPRHIWNFIHNFASGRSVAAEKHPHTQQRRMRTSDATSFRNRWQGKNGVDTLPETAGKEKTESARCRKLLARKKLSRHAANNRWQGKN